MGRKHSKIISASDGPAIIKAVDLGGHPTRREFVLGLLAAATAGTAACVTAEVKTQDGVCTCDAVCTCDSEGDSPKSEKNSVYGESGKCLCHTVCTCDTVNVETPNCACDLVTS